MCFQVTVPSLYARRRVWHGAPPRRSAARRAAVQSNGSRGGERGPDPLLGGVCSVYKYTASVAETSLEHQ